MSSEEDIRYMRMALELAERGRGYVGPNPMVGAVIVRDGRVLAKGWHRVYGSLHAERDALASCSSGSVKGATMYVTLEPCCHHGKQPPCTDAVIAAGISRVVMAMTDPNPLVAGRGVSILRGHGIEVTTGVLETEARHLNRIFIKYITTRQPWVVLKWAMTLDGRIAAFSGDSKWVSGERSRHLVHELRGRYMGIVAGIGTVLADDPMLNCRVDGMRQPVRVIVDSRASMPVDSRIARTAGEYRTVLAHTESAQEQSLAALRSCGVETLLCSASAGGRVDVGDMLGRLGAMGLDSVLVEGGGELNWSFIEAGLADEYYVFVAPKIVGGSGAKGPVGGAGFGTMGEACGMAADSVERCGEDVLIHGFSEKYRQECLQE